MDDQKCPECEADFKTYGLIQMGLYVNLGNEEVEVYECGNCAAAGMIVDGKFEPDDDYAGLHWDE